MEITDHMELIPGLTYDVSIECLIRIPFYQILKAASVCKDWMIQIQLPEFWHRRRAAGFTRPFIVMAQARAKPNQNDHWDARLSNYQLTICDPERGLWSQLPSIPGFEQGLPMFCQTVGVGRKLLVMGGFHPVTWKTLNSVFIYDFLTGTWRHGADIPGGRRSFFGCASDDARAVLVAGGHDGNKNALRSAMVYDVAMDAWTILPDMARERDECKCIFMRGRFHVIGGYCTERQGCFEKSAEALDLDKLQWDELENFLPDSMNPKNCATDCNESLYVFLGADLFELKESKWEMLAAELPDDDQLCNILCFTAWSGKLLMISLSRSSGCLSAAYAIDLVNGVFTRKEIPSDHSSYPQSVCYLEI